jgi:hypothetical protein
VSASSGTFGSAQELGVEAMGPFTHYVVKAHGNSRDVIAHLDALSDPSWRARKFLRKGGVAIGFAMSPTSLSRFTLPNCQQESSR